MDYTKPAHTNLITRIKFSFCRDTFLIEILGILPEGTASGEATLKPYRDAVDLLLSIRSEAKAKKDWATSDLIRNRMAEIGFTVKDTKDGVEWSI